MNPLHPRRYVFRGHSTGVAAHIRRPDKHFVQVQGCSALPPTGGHHEEKVEAKRHNELISHGPISTSAYGDYADAQAGVDTTYGTVAFDAVPIENRVTASVQDLDILGRVHIGLAAMGLSATCAQNGNQHEIHPEGCRLEDVRIDDARLKIELAEDFYRECNTLQKLAGKHSAGMPDDHKCLLVDDDATSTHVAGGAVRWTLVKKIEWDGKPHPDAEIHGNVVRVPDFGKIYFGEMSINEHSRRLTMVRCQLGSPHGGEIVAADGESNGGTWPPV